MLRKLLSGVSAGILISIGGTVFLNTDNKYIGSVMFAVALLCICYKGYSLFTGKVGFIPEKHGKEEISVLLIGLLGNTVATVVCGYMIRYAVPASAIAAETVCMAKLNQLMPQTFIRAVFCGILMYLAVSIFRDNKTPVGIIFCIPVFILSGFEHSIADIFYFSAAGIVSAEAFVYLFIVILGNFVGGILLPLINMIGKEKSQNE